MRTGATLRAWVWASAVDRIRGSATASTITAVIYLRKRTAAALMAGLGVVLVVGGVLAAVSATIFFVVLDYIGVALGVWAAVSGVTSYVRAKRGGE